MSATDIVGRQGRGRGSGRGWAWPRTRSAPPCGRTWSLQQGRLPRLYESVLASSHHGAVQRHVTSTEG